MGRWRSILWGVAAIACSSLLVACSTAGRANLNAAQIEFEGKRPAWADAATLTMSELEAWRGLEFTDDVRVAFQSEAAPGLHGWYDSTTKQLVVAATESARLGRSVLLHEMFHALQDDHFNLYGLRQQSAEDPEFDKAVSALIEGEAMLAVSELMDYDFLAHAKLPVDGPVSEAQFEKIFLYGAGMKFARAIRADGGWEAVNAAFRDPPRATALILHPDRYLAGEREIEAIPILLESGETLRNQTVRGEYQVQWMLARHPATRALLDIAAEGYVADTLGTFEDAEGMTQQRWVVEFASPQVAADLVEGFQTAIAADPHLAAKPSVFADGIAIVAEW